MAVAAACASASPPVAAAHSVGSYRSAVVSVKPHVAGIDVDAADGNLTVTNRSRSIVEIRGYEDEPYLRFTPGGVFRNARSPSGYLNEAQGGASMPASADARAIPLWVKVADGGTYTWHDHRTHWMGATPPKVIRGAHVLDWKVAARVDGKPFVISGSLDEVPQESYLTELLTGLVLLNVIFVLALARYAGALPGRLA
jgi:hypothetical protein